MSAQPIKFIGFVVAIIISDLALLLNFLADPFFAYSKIDVSDNMLANTTSE